MIAGQLVGFDTDFVHCLSSSIITTLHSSDVCIDKRKYL